jgi:hypothetical protein
MLGPLIGFPGPGKRGHCTVAKLARAIVAGSVRRTVESRVSEIQVRTRRTLFPFLLICKAATGLAWCIKATSALSQHTLCDGGVGCDVPPKYSPHLGIDGVAVAKLTSTLATL